MTKQQSSPLHIENTVNSLSKQDLKLPYAFKTYRSMLDDEMIGAGISLIQNLTNKTPYSIEANKDSSPEEIKLVNKLNESMKNLSGMTKVEFINYVLSMLPYGHSIFEMVFTRKEGTLVFDTFSPIHPINVKRYVYKHNTLLKLELTPADNDGLIFNSEVMSEDLKGEKILMFKLNSDLDNPLGRSLLSRTYIPWKKKEIVGEYELISVAKNLSGVMKIKAPAEYINDYQNKPNSDNAMYLTDLIDQAELMHGGKSSVVVVASDTTDTGVALFDITTLGNNDGNDVDTNAIMNRLDTSILTTLYTDILTLGQGTSGSFALSDSKTSLLALFIDSLFNVISTTFSKAIKQAYDLNGVKPKTSYATLKFAEVESLDFEAFTRGWQRLVESGIVIADEKLEDYVRDVAKAPLRDDATKRVRVESSTSPINNDRKEKEK